MTNMADIAIIIYNDKYSSYLSSFLLIYHLWSEVDHSIYFYLPNSIIELYWIFNI